MNDIIANWFFVFLLAVSYFHFRSLFRKSSRIKDKQIIIKKFSKIRIMIFSGIWMFILIPSLIHYHKNIFANLILGSILIGSLIFIFYKKIKNKGKIFCSLLELSITIIVVILFLINTTIITNKLLYISQGEDMAISEIDSGDILFRHTGEIDILIPGYWSHIGLVTGRTNGTINVIESTTDGIHMITLNEFMGKSRISIAKPKNMTDQSKEIVIDFAKSKIGLPYNFDLINKKVNNTSYYCSELIWASYQQVGIEIDKNPGFSIQYINSVAPQEIFGDDDFATYHINKLVRREIYSQLD